MRVVWHAALAAAFSILFAAPARRRPRPRCTTRPSRDSERSAALYPLRRAGPQEAEAALHDQAIAGQRAQRRALRAGCERLDRPARWSMIFVRQSGGRWLILDRHSSPLPPAP